MSEVYAEADFHKIQTALTETGFIAPAPPWPVPDRAALDAELAGYAERQGSAAQELAPDPA